MGFLSMRYFCTKSSSQKWSKTVSVPKSDLPSRRSLKLDLKLLQNPCFKNLYKDQCDRDSTKTYTLHDGPPYANGSIHFGHVINKTLKDIICRYRIRQGYKVNFIPGWDCHGLPIELKVYKETDKSPTQPLEVRRKAKCFAQSAIEDQIEVFKRMGIAADWDHPYTTFSTRFVVNQLDAFKNLYQKGMIHRSFLPIYFSPSNKTTLAESELEYNPNHISPSILFQFKVHHSMHLAFDYDTYALIWTTTPWTLPGNQGIAFSPAITYVVASASKLSRYFIIAQEKIPEIEPKIGSQLHVEKVLTREDFQNLFYIHPMKPDERKPFLPADYVTISKGTGLVHCAPNHGREDFDLARKYHLPIDRCLVDDEGNFVHGIDSRLDGVSVVDHGSKIVMQLLSNDIVHRENFVHSYPYDWRSGKPVIIKTSLQWFVRVDTIRERCLTALDKVEAFPSGIKNKIRDEISRRPDWCISRQRVWGIPIPVFYRKTDLSRVDPIISSESIDHLISIIKDNGVDIWWEKSANELLSDSVSRSLNVDRNNLVTGRDIFDVWFDSGITWNSILDGHKIADLYLEGVDQCHGWFQTSLLLSVALRDEAPYKSIYVHGFAVDANGHKMSKSIGNVVDPFPLIETHGCDVVRLFVTRYGSHHGNVKVDEENLKTTIETLMKYRNVLKFCLGALANYNHSSDLEMTRLNLINRYSLHQLWKFNQLCQEKYQANDFRSIIIESSNFLNDFSSFYLKIVKDSLYCDAPTDFNRRSIQMIIYYLLETLNNFLGPIIPFLFEEINLLRKKDENASSCMLDDWFECPTVWKEDQIESTMEIIRRIKDYLDSDTDDVKHFGKPFTMQIVCHQDSDYETLKTFEQDISRILQLSNVKLSRFVDTKSVDCAEKITCPEDFPFTLLLEKTEKFLCPRCRQYLADHLESLCPRCNIVVHNQTL